ncbi:MAG: PQQ-binding-like beta-propeller repeat protein [Opitutae bacterium]|nr:PQQ-binding-like beta-propeller repeat protein [Opitutae bacterium]
MKRFLYSICILFIPVPVICSDLGPGEKEPPILESNRFRGADGSGIYTAKNLLLSWNDNDYLWTLQLPGDGHSSPIAWRDQIYVTSTDRGNPRLILLCLDSRSGQEIWRSSFTSAAHRLHRLSSYATSTPAVDRYHVYMVWSNHGHFNIAALDHAGKEVWRRDLGTRVTSHGGETSPIVLDDMVIVTNDSRGPSSIHALDRMTGETLWKRERPNEPKGKASYCTPLVYRTARGDEQLIFNSTSSGMTALNPENGEVLWAMPHLFPDRTILSPVRIGEYIFASCGSGTGGATLTAVLPPTRAGAEPEIAYEIRKSAPYVPTPVGLGDRLFMVNDGGIATCIDAPSGEEIWKAKLGDSFFSSPIRVDDRIYAVSRRADVVVFRASDAFEILGRTLINQDCHATPIVHQGNLYLRTVSHLYCIGPR